MKDVFCFELGQTVKLALSDEAGVVIGRASNLYCENQYLIRYKDANGYQTEHWWGESAVSGALGF